MNQTDYQSFYDLAVPRLFEVASYQKLMCGKVENLGKSAQADATHTDIHTALTYLDQFSQDYLLVPIYQQWPDLVPLVEEDTGLKRHNLDNNSDYSLIMDPIDGTAFYLRGDSDYSIMLGLMHKGQMVLAIICYPEKGEVIAAIKGQGAWRHHADGSTEALPNISAVKTNHRSIACHYRLPKAPYARLAARLLSADHTLCTNDDGFGTNATGILRIASGESAAFIGPHISLHDFAVPAFVIEQLGGVVRLFAYDGPDDTASWNEVLPDYGRPSPKGSNPRYRVIIADSDETIDDLLATMLG